MNGVSSNHTDVPVANEPTISTHREESEKKTAPEQIVENIPNENEEESQ